MRVLIIPEDPTLDQHVLRPVVQKIFEDLGRPARVEVLTDPHISGISVALDPGQIAAILEDNRMIDLFLLMVDRDCDRYGNEAKAAARRSEHAGRLISALAWQETEVWPLALHREQLRDSWAEVRADCDPKERYFDPFIAEQGWAGTVGRGRKRAMRDLGRGWRGLLSVCPEPAELKEEIQRWLRERAA